MQLHYAHPPKLKKLKKLKGFKKPKFGTTIKKIKLPGFGASRRP